MSAKIDKLITAVMRREGWDTYTDHPADSGGPTKWGITQETLSDWRDQPVTDKDVKELGESEAREIYLHRYWTGPGFDQVTPEKVAHELLDTGINMGPEAAGTFLQRALNAFNNRGNHYPDLVIDGGVGPKTREALTAYIQKRGATGQRVLLFSLDAMQAERYVSIAEAREKDEEFVYGQILHRAANAWRY